MTHEILSADELPIEFYHHSAPHWLSKTSLMAFHEHGPAWWKLAYLDKAIETKKDTAAMRQGRALDDALCMSEDEWDKRWVVKPDWVDGRTTDGKAWLKSMAHLSQLSEQEYEILLDCAAAVRNSWAWPHIEAAQSQRTIRRRSDALGLGFQARPDWFTDDAVFDLKKTADLERFGRDAIGYGYHLQAALAGWCLERNDLSAHLVAVEWARGARCRVYRIPPDVLAAGFSLCRQIAGEIARRLSEDDWTDRQAEPQDLEVPEYLRRKMEAA